LDVPTVEPDPDPLALVQTQPLGGITKGMLILPYPTQSGTRAEFSDSGISPRFRTLYNIADTKVSGTRGWGKPADSQTKYLGILVT